MPAIPTMAEVLRRSADSRISDVWTAIPAKVISYDASTQTVDCQPVVRRPVPSDDQEGAFTFEELPIVPDVAVAFPRGGGCAVTWPISPGDFVELIVQTLAIAQWQETGETADPGDLRTHSLGNCIAIPCLGFAPIDATQAGTAAYVIDAPEILLVKEATDYVALASLVANELAAIAATLGTGSTPAANGGGGDVTFATAYSPGNVAATKVKAL